MNKQWMKVAAGFGVCTLSCLSTAAKAHAAPLRWSGNGHYYEFVSADLTLTQVNDAIANRPTFMGVTGHLVTITSAAEQAFLNTNLLQGANTPQYWIAASDRAVEDEWRWTSGPEAGQKLDDLYTNWRMGEPNNANLNGENFAVANWIGLGEWNDVTEFRRAAYVVEYSQVQAVPTPALFPAALGVMVAVWRRRR